MIGPEAWKLLDQSTQYSVRLVKMLADKVVIFAKHISINMC